MSQAGIDRTGGPLSLVAHLRTAETQTANRVDQVAHQIETAIAVGLVADGERLPPEPDLASQLGVSMQHVRQALAVLRDRRLIETRRGRGGGSIVRSSDVVSTDEIERRLIERSTEALRDLGDLAGSVVASAARLAAARADDQEVTRLRDLADDFAKADNPHERRRSDSRFHIGLAIAAQSRRLTSLSVQVQGERAPLLWTSPEFQPQSAEIVAFHRAIVDSIAEGDELVAHQRALSHNAHETERLIEAHLELIMSRSSGH